MGGGLKREKSWSPNPNGVGVLERPSMEADDTAGQGKVQAEVGFLR